MANIWVLTVEDARHGKEVAGVFSHRDFAIEAIIPTIELQNRLFGGDTNLEQLTDNIWRSGSNVLHIVPMTVNQVKA